MGIVVLEFGGQYTDLIGNRLDEMGFQVRYADHDTPLSELQDADGIILSGGPKSVREPDSYRHDPALFTTNKPVLGICYGMQLLGQNLGDETCRVREYGGTRINVFNDEPLFAEISRDLTVWMNHGDSLTGSGAYKVLARSGKGVPAAIKSNRGPHYGVQFHPEVTHTEQGKVMLGNFAGRICGSSRQEKHVEEFDPSKFIPDALNEIREGVGNRKAHVFTSTGVDSSVALALGIEAGVETNAMYLEMGNGEREVYGRIAALEEALGTKISVVDRGEEFRSTLSEYHDPEARRKLFAELYANMGIDVLRGIEPEGKGIFIDGTIATDKRETGKEAGKGSGDDRGTVDTIKTHHNAYSHSFLENAGEVVTPLQGLTKERVRMVAKEIGLPEEVASRPPFPGPGLYVRFDTALYSVPPELAEEVAYVVKQKGMEGFVLPRKGVGLKGDSRAYEHVALLTGRRDWSKVKETAKALVEDHDICRVLYSPNPLDITQEQLTSSISYPMSERNLNGLREVTSIVNDSMNYFDVHPSQTPVITFGGPESPFFVIRDFDSVDFRTGRPLEKPGEFPWECFDEIDSEIYGFLVSRWKKPIVVFDASDKPAGTTEWM